MKLHLGNCDEHPRNHHDPTLSCWAIRDETNRRIGPDELMEYIEKLDHAYASVCNRSPTLGLILAYDAAKAESADEIKSLQAQLNAAPNCETCNHIERICQSERRAMNAEERASKLEHFICHSGGLVNEWAKSCPFGTKLTDHIKNKLNRYIITG